MINEIKQIIENYLNNRDMTAVVVATYTGGKYVLNEKAYVPDSIVYGSLKSAVSNGDKVLLLRNDGGLNYYVIDILGFRPYLKGKDTNVEN